MDIRVRCAKCKKDFYRPIGRVNEAKKFRWNQYCSSDCMAKARARGRITKCSNPNCEKLIYRPRKEIGKVTHSFCSRSCAAHVNNKKFPKRIQKLKMCERVGYEKIISTRLRYCSRACFRVEQVIDTPQNLVKKLQTFAQELCRTPSKREMRSIAEACIWAFGSWNEAVIAAGLTPHRSHSKRMFRRTNTKAVDGHLCDSISEALVDNWLTEHKIPHQRNVRYPNTGHKADWGIESHVFVEYFGLAHDSPRYDRTIQQKRLLCKRHYIRLVEIYAPDLYPTIKLEGKLGEFSLK